MIALYVLATVAGNLAFWQCGLMYRLFYNHHRWRVDWPDPDEAPAIFLYLLTPLPGLVAVLNFTIATGERMGIWTNLKPK